MIIILAQVAVFLIWILPSFMATNRAINTDQLSGARKFFLISLSWLIPLAGPLYTYTVCANTSEPPADQ